MDGININYNQAYCINRLPCGYCTLLNRPCPMMFGQQYEPTWKPEITCSTEVKDAKSQES